MSWLLLAVVLGVVGYAINGGVQAYNNNRNIKEQEKLQEDAQEFTHQERIEQNEANYKQWMQQTSEAPLLQFDSYKSLGMSDAAALQAIAGGSTQLGNTASNIGSGIASAPSTPTDAFGGLANVMNDLFKNENLRSNTNRNNSEIQLNDARVEEIYNNMDINAKRLGIETEQLELAKNITNSQIGLMETEANLNIAKLNEVNSSIGQIIANTKNLDADTALKAVQRSLVLAQTENVQSSTAVNEAQVEYIGSQTEYVEAQTVGQEYQNTGQSIQNDTNELDLALKRARFEVSKALGVDVDSDINSKILTAMVMGRYDTVDKLIKSSQITASGSSGSIERAINQVFNGQRKVRNQGLREQVHSSSFQPTWNPSPRPRGKKMYQNKE